MQTETIRRQYDDVISVHYDSDPQSITSYCQDYALTQLHDEEILTPGTILNVLDLGMGTGMFFEKLCQQAERELSLFGVDLSENMVSQAQKKHPELRAAVDDAANFDKHFPEVDFDLICTHFISGFVPISHLAPRVFARLAPGGYWCFLGAVRSAYPELQQKANSIVVKMMFGSRQLDLNSMVQTPRDREDVVQQFEDQGFQICRAECVNCPLKFPNYKSFMDYAYYGGWLTPYIEGLGLQCAGKMSQFLLNRLVFPMNDEHHVVATVARKPFMGVPNL